MQKTVDNQVKTDMLGKAAGPGRGAPQKNRDPGPFRMVGTRTSM